jgi:hypothetical protein
MDRNGCYSLYINTAIVSIPKTALTFISAQLFGLRAVHPQPNPPFNLRPRSLLKQNTHPFDIPKDMGSNDCLSIIILSTITQNLKVRLSDWAIDPLLQPLNPKLLDINQQFKSLHQHL